MSDNSDSPLFVDTSAFVAAYIENDPHHGPADTVFGDIRAGESLYDSVYTTQHLLCETEVVVSIRGNTSIATTVVDEITRSGTVNVLPVSASMFEDARAEYLESDGTGISLFDHLSGVVANENDIEHVFTFDGDFATLGFTVVPTETGEPVNED